MKPIALYLCVFLAIASLLLSSCQQTEQPCDDRPPIEMSQQAQLLQHPEWTKDAAIYEVNIRQYTEEGTFAAFEKHLPRIKELGVEVLWLMPIYPIGEEKRKGSMGSYYAVKDFKAVNPKFGTMDEFKSLVQKIHEMDMKVILDWVPNHSAWDNALAKDHPDWYEKNLEGEFMQPLSTDWSDVMSFDYSNPGLRAYMIEALKFWIEEADVDGYRCDVAGFVPIDFWEEARPALDEVKPVFMLAEWETPDLHLRAFDMTYGWKFYHELKEIAEGKKDAGAIRGYLYEKINTFPQRNYKMYFTENHDENSWNGTTRGIFGEGLEAAMVVAAMMDGMPLVYSGQEANNQEQLAFFEKDEIEWKEHEFAQMYRTLFDLKKENEALWNGEWGGRAEPLNLNEEEAKGVVAFIRRKNGHKVLVLANFSDKAQSISFKEPIYEGNYTSLFDQQSISLDPENNSTLELDAWGYKVLHL